MIWSSTSSPGLGNPAKIRRLKMSEFWPARRNENDIAEFCNGEPIAGRALPNNPLNPTSFWAESRHFGQMRLKHVFRVYNSARCLKAKYRHHLANIWERWYAAPLRLLHGLGTC